MSEVTLELVQSRQTELAAMIETLERKSQMTTLRVPAQEIVLFPGEWHAGAVLNEDGSLKHHLIVAAVSGDTHNYEQANAWSKERGYSAPTRQEARLIIAHKYGHFGGVSWTWFWTSEPYPNSSSAWCCVLSSGYVGSDGRSSLGGAVAVRRLNP